MASAQVCSLPTASIATWLPPPMRSPTADGMSDSVGKEGVLRAELGGHCECLPVAVHGDYAGAECAGDHHRAQADSAGTDHGDPLTLGDSRASRERAVRRGEPASEAGRRREVHLLRDGDQVGVRGVQSDVLSKGTPVREPWLFLFGTDLRVAP